MFPISQGGPLLILGSRGQGYLRKFEFVAVGGGVVVPLKHINFKWMSVGSRVNDILVYTLSALVYSLHHDQTVLKRTLSVNVRTYKE